VGGLIVGNVQILSDGTTLFIDSNLTADAASVLSIKSYKIYAGVAPLQLSLLGIPLLDQFSLLGTVDDVLCSVLSLRPLISVLGLTCGLNLNLAINLQLVNTITGQILNAWAVNDLLSATVSLGSPLCCP